MSRIPFYMVSIFYRNITHVPRTFCSYPTNTIATAYTYYETGRPFPLKGRYYANVFLHFEPHGHTERFNEIESRDATIKQTAKERYVNAMKNPSPPPKKHNIPDYIQAGSEEEKKWKQQYIFQAVEPVRVWLCFFQRPRFP